MSTDGTAAGANWAAVDSSGTWNNHHRTAWGEQQGFWHCGWERCVAFGGTWGQQLEAMDFLGNDHKGC